ncbi:MAG: carboxypeptidase regulatory-like domain-containing protein [Candidatus Bathyarchaeia archaeon]|nr:carboxypeptidase regulatory-like domain-containing protein [Candidatus Bathyarchaeota archaeon]
MDVKGKREITGRVFDEEGRPIAGVTVTCDGEETKTLFDGSYKFDGLPIGHHIVEVAVERYKTQKHHIEILREEETVVLDFHLEPREGDSKIFGYVLDGSTWEPIKTGGSVYMSHPSLNRYTPINPFDGYYEFTHLPPGQYTLWVSLVEYEDEMKIVEVRNGEEKREDFIINKKREEIPWG